MKRLAIVLLVAAACSAPQDELVQEQGQELTLENMILNNRSVRDAAISPDGRWVAAVGAGPQGQGIYLLSTQEPSPKAELWTQGRSPAWSADSNKIVFLRERDLWTIERGSNQPERITQDDADERAPVFSPDGGTIAFYSSRSGHQDIWLVAAQAGSTPRQLTNEAMALDDPRFAPAWSPDGKSIAYVSNAADYWEDDIWVIDVENGGSRQVSKTLMASSTPRWSPDGKRIALLGTAKAEFWYEDLAYIYVLEPESGSERTVDMQVDATDWLHNHGAFWSGDSQQLYFLYMQRGDFHLWTVPAQGGVATRVSNAGGAVRVFDATPDASGFVFVRHTPLRGAEADYIGRQGGPMRRLTHFASEWKDLQPPEEISFRSYDGLYIQGFLFRPPGWGSGKKFPGLIQVHGGGTNSYLHGQNLLEQHLANQGYIVLAVNYRGGSGFGRSFQDLSINDWANGQARDAAAAGEFVRSMPECTGKLGIYGYSYGGIMSMATIARSPDVFDAAVPMAGIYDFGDAYTNADRLGKIFIKTGHGGSPEERPEIYAISNSLARVQQIKTPLLLMHGERDVRAPYRQFELAVELLERHGKQFESKSYPGEPHGFRDPQNRLDLYQRLEAFMDKHLKN